MHSSERTSGAPPAPRWKPGARFSIDLSCPEGRVKEGRATLCALLLFGGTRLPKLARSLGQASKEFKAGVAEGAKDDDEDAKKDAKTD